MKKNTTILAIETSCDETASAIIHADKRGQLKVLSNIVSSQINLHKKTSGVVPEVASRAHVEKIILIIDKALKRADVEMQNIDIIAVTTGPGLIGSLMIGVDTAKALSYIYNIPVIGINHIEAHIYANFVNNGENTIKFPLIALIVSGGHTILSSMRGHGKYKIIGSTIDDAAGESFDKVARILNLSYPGGPSVSKCAEEINNKYKGPYFVFPRPLINRDNFDFSFSGLKTSVLYKVRQLNESKINSSEYSSVVASEFQKSVVDVLVNKTIKAARKYEAKSIILGGGVAANKLLRKEMKRSVDMKLKEVGLFIPDIKLCTDNAVAIGVNAYYKYLYKREALSKWEKVNVNLSQSL